MCVCVCVCVCVCLAYIREYYVRDFYAVVSHSGFLRYIVSDSGFLRSGMLRSGLLRTGKLRSAMKRLLVTIKMNLLLKNIYKYTKPYNYLQAVYRIYKHTSFTKVI